MTTQGNNWSADKTQAGLHRTASSADSTGVSVLNPRLYFALRNVFPEVGIVKNGIPYEGRVIAASGTGHRYVDRVEGGEEYHVSCPNCGDSRKRLYINHRWNTEYKGCRMRYALFCQNEQCHASPGFINRLTEMLNCGEVYESDIRTDIEINPTALKAEVTGKFVPVNELPSDHVAVKYLRDVRELPIDRLGDIWGVTWAEYSIMLPPDNRLFFPIRAEDPDNPGTLTTVGGQAHWLDAKTLNGTPSADQRKDGAVKWYTVPGTKTGRNLYNADIAKTQKDLIVITEGAFDVMRIGTKPGLEKYAVGVFGHSVSEHQKQLLWDNWGKHDAVAILAFDPDVYTRTDKQGRQDLNKVLALEVWFEQQWKYFHALRLIDKDIGAMRCEEVWEIIDNILGGFTHGLV